MRVTPLVPARTPAQVSLVPMPSADTSPMPVTTTRLLKLNASGVAMFDLQSAMSTGIANRKSKMSFLALRVRLDVVDGFLDAGDLLGVLVRDLDPELLLEGHHELHGVERVGAEIVDERRIRRHFLFIHTELLHDDALHLVCDSHCPSCLAVVHMYMPPLTART